MLVHISDDDDDTEKCDSCCLVLKQKWSKHEVNHHLGINEEWKQPLTNILHMHIKRDSERKRERERDATISYEVIWHHGKEIKVVVANNSFGSVFFNRFFLLLAHSFNEHKLDDIIWCRMWHEHQQTHTHTNRQHNEMPHEYGLFMLFAQLASVFIISQLAVSNVHFLGH